ncbi:type VI secretion system baseplate subunit TssF [Nitrincola sp. MINF-07-Sa-05]|uniref:type VI secretion system baseplate subunit TssF n=1 Tax=Nitrincola salilacus TaxID=3400273 RepID=UPI00391857C2
MKAALVELYQKELNYLERVGEDFAQKYPKIAHRLQLSEPGSRDPHVERLVQATALLNARIRAKLEDDYPELNQAIFDLIYPHYLKPLPSHTVVSFQPSPDLSTVVHIPRGSLLESSASLDRHCRFSTLYDVNVMPLSITQAVLQPAPFDAPQISCVNQMAGVLHLAFDRSGLDAQAIAGSALQSVRIYLNAPKYIAYQLYELLFSQVSSLALAKSALDTQPILLSKDIIKAVGFSPDEAAWIYSEQSFPGYRLLSEFFVFPEKFLFVELDLSSLQQLVSDGETFSLFFYLNRAYDEIASHITAEHFQLNATPVVNLYSHMAEPIRISHTRSAYPVVADARNRQDMKVYSIESAMLSDGSDHATPLSRFFDFEGYADYSGRPFWHFSHDLNEADAAGPEAGISLHNLPLDVLSSNRHLLLLECLVTNGNLPHELWKLGKLSHLSLFEANPGVENVRICLPVKPAIVDYDRDGHHWKLISHLNLNYLSLGNPADSSSILKEILSLYDFKNSPETRKMIEALEVLAIVPEARRILSPSGMAFFCRGSRFSVRLDPNNFPGTSPFLFCTVLERFLSVYTSINSFTQLDVQLSQSEEAYFVWPPRTGEQCLI